MTSVDARRAMRTLIGSGACGWCKIMHHTCAFMVGFELLRLGSRCIQSAGHPLAIGEAFSVPMNAATTQNTPQIDILEAVLTPHDVQQTLAALADFADDFDTDPDSVDAQPTYEIKIVDHGRWERKFDALRIVLAKPFAELETRVRQLRRNEPESDNLVVNQVLIRHYAVGERRSHPVHFDEHAMATAVCSLSPPVTDSGLYVQHGPHVSSREFVSFGEAGDFVVHGSDVLHGVDVSGKEDRLSLIVWFKPRDDVRYGGDSWYDKLAASGNAHAEYRLGMRCQQGGDEAGAVRWFESAANRGHWPSMHRLGRLMRSTSNVESSLQWFWRAAKLGYAAAQVDLGDMLCRGPLQSPELGSEAAVLYEAAAAQGHPAGQHRVARMRFHAGVDLEGARELLQASAEWGYADAQLDLGRLVELAGSSPSKALEWYRRAAAQGHSIAERRLSELRSRLQSSAA